ncbi:DUF6307 family protein [Pseudonocardia sp. GCM10023141]|uniref:DUF6307 family protein n=1 Tax=Pseudonocardia sp. GCM10023141 TaxID=3252653 RepID=UPI00361A5910
MTSTTTPYISIYQQRVNLVAKAITDHSDLDDKTAVNLAAHILEAIERIPEKVR